jgi:hypothetical protein
MVHPLDFELQRDVTARSPVRLRPASCSRATTLAPSLRGSSQGTGRAALDISLSYGSRPRILDYLDEPAGTASAVRHMPDIYWR